MANPIDLQLLALIECGLLHARVQTELSDWMKKSNSVSILVCGKTGTGKSTLVNGLVGKLVAQEGEELDAMTSKVTNYDRKIGNIQLAIWDSPGLRDRTSREESFLADIKTHCRDVDLFLYCIQMSETRFGSGSDDVVSMKKLTQTLGNDLWANAIIVLTFAQDIEEEAEVQIDDPSDPQKTREYFESKLEEWARDIHDILVDEIKVPKDITSQVSVLPAGYRTQLSLPDRQHWFSELWLASLRAMKPRAQPAMIQINAHRFAKGCITVDEARKLLHEQSILFMKKGAEIGLDYSIEGFVSGKRIIVAPGSGMNLGAIIADRVSIETNLLLLLGLQSGIVQDVQPS